MWSHRISGKLSLMDLKLAKKHKTKCGTPAINGSCTSWKGQWWDILEIILGPQRFMLKITGCYIILKATFQILLIALNCREMELMRNNDTKLLCKIISFFYQCSKLCDRAFSARQNWPFLWCKYCIKRKLTDLKVSTECFQDIWLLCH